MIGASISCWGMVLWDDPEEFFNRINDRNECETLDRDCGCQGECEKQKGPEASPPGLSLNSDSTRHYGTVCLQV